MSPKKLLLATLAILSLAGSSFAKDCSQSFCDANSKTLQQICAAGQRSALFRDGEDFCICWCGGQSKKPNATDLSPSPQQTEEFTPWQN